MKKKIIITILGFMVLITIQVLVNIFLCGKEPGLTTLLLPVYIIMYYTYIQLMVKKYLKKWMLQPLMTPFWRVALRGY